MTKALEPEILFENDDYIAVNKPAGLVVHADGRTAEATVSDWVLKRHPEMKEVGEPIVLSNGEKIYRPGIVHRIDRDTSGVLLLAKNQKAFDALKAQFQNREVEKVYHAFVYGAMKEPKGTIDRPIARSAKDFRLWSAQRGSRGERREAVTLYKVIEKIPDATFVEAHPKTGRTHQIRVHFKAINHPVIADPLYAPKREAMFGFKRLALHAKSASFKLLDGSIKTVEAPYPEDFAQALELFKKASAAAGETL